MRRLATTILGVLALTGCFEEDRLRPLVGTVSLEVLDSAEVVIVPRDAVAASFTVTPSAGFGLMAPGTTLSADGTIEAFPEATSTLYTAKLSGPAIADGPCGDQPVSLALSLHRQGDHDTVLGGISAYCGADTWYGVPARVLRLAGPIPTGR